MNSTFPVSRQRVLYVLAVACFYVIASIVGARGEDIGSDTQNYISLFQRTLACECVVDTVEPLFGVMTHFSTYLSSDETFFLGIVSIFQLLAALWLATVLHRLLGFHSYDIRFLSLFLASLFLSPFFQAGQINVIRQGLSAFFVVLAILAITERKYLASLMLSIIGIGFHYSALLYLCAIPLLLIRHSHRRLVFIILVFLYATGLTQYLVRVFSELLGLPVYAFVSDYGETSDYVGGVRLDFLAFSLIPIIVSWFVNSITGNEMSRERIRYVSNIYMVLLVPFLLFGWAAYSDRFAYGAWLLMPAFLTIFLVRILPRRAFVLPIIILISGALYFVNSINVSA